jgi:hypothetical protein
MRGKKMNKGERVKGRRWLKGRKGSEGREEKSGDMNAKGSGEGGEKGEREGGEVSYIFVFSFKMIEMLLFSHQLLCQLNLGGNWSALKRSWGPGPSD